MSATSDPDVRPDGHLVIRQVADLPKVLGLKRHIRRLELDLPGMEGQEKAVAEARLAARIGACGCTEGAVGLLAALPVSSLVWLMTQGAFGPFARLGLCLSIIVVGALLGKATGLLRARRGLRAEVARIQSRLGA